MYRVAANARVISERLKFPFIIWVVFEAVPTTNPVISFRQCRAKTTFYLWQLIKIICVSDICSSLRSFHSHYLGTRPQKRPKARLVPVSEDGAFMARATFFARDLGSRVRDVRKSKACPLSASISPSLSAAAAKTDFEMLTYRCFLNAHPHINMHQLEQLLAIRR